MEQLKEKAKSIHDSILKLDAHVDIEVTFMTEEKPGVLGYEKLFSWEYMVQGDINGAFFAVYTLQPKKGEEDYEKVLAEALDKFQTIHKNVNERPDKLVLVTRSKDVQKQYKAGKRAVMIGIENGYPIGYNLQNLDMFYNLGCRYITLSHAGHNQICDSNVALLSQDTVHDGLSSFGQDVVRKMNTIGMMIDVSHVHRNTVLQVSQLSKAPIIASHAACRALCDVPRNMDDDMLKAVKDKGGVVHIIGLGNFIKKDLPKKEEIINNLRKEFGLPTELFLFSAEFYKLPAKVQARYKDRLLEINKKYPSANVADYVDHIDYAVELIGIDHVGISSDFYDYNYSIVGWEHAGRSLNITHELVKREYSKKDIEKLWALNLLRVWKEVEAAAG